MPKFQIQYYLIDNLMFKRCQEKSDNDQQTGWRERDLDIHNSFAQLQLIECAKGNVFQGSRISFSWIWIAKREGGGRARSAPLCTEWTDLPWIAEQVFIRAEPWLGDWEQINLIEGVTIQYKRCFRFYGMSAWEFCLTIQYPNLPSDAQCSTKITLRKLANTRWFITAT